MKIGPNWEIKIPSKKFTLKILSFIFVCNFIFYLFFSEEKTTLTQKTPPPNPPKGYVALQLFFVPHLELISMNEVGLWSNNGRLLVEKAIYVAKLASSENDEGNKKATFFLKKEELTQIVGEERIHVMPAITQKKPTQKMSNTQPRGEYDLSF